MLGGPIKHTFKFSLLVKVLGNLGENTTLLKNAHFLFDLIYQCILNFCAKTYLNAEFSTHLSIDSFVTSTQLQNSTVNSCNFVFFQMLKIPNENQHFLVKNASISCQLYQINHKCLISSIKLPEQLINLFNHSHQMITPKLHISQMSESNHQFIFW